MLYRVAVGGALLAGVLLASQLTGQQAPEITFQEFKQRFLEDEEQKVARLKVVNGNVVHVYLGKSTQKGPDYFFTIGSTEVFERQLKEAQEMLGIPLSEFIHVTYEDGTTIRDVAPKVAPLLLTIGLVFYMFRGKGPSSLQNMFGIAKSPAKRYDNKTGPKVTFEDVAGLEEAKNEIMEFVSFLKNPSQYTSLGAKIPKGALLVGPPGTGKTLLAKAAAGEASVPFFSISGSDFIEMYVGVGPARVRELFGEARKNAPCIVFIDEIDAVGKARGREGMRNDERDNTLNQLLVEMDGFNTTAGVVVLAGTNRPEILDKALLRPGRFDRQIALDSPDIKSREEIFKVHLKPLKLAVDINENAKKLAAMTPGFSGADIANVCNEAALIAARNGKNAIDDHDFDAAVDRIIGGLEKKNKVLTYDDKKTIAFHEAGHAVASWYLPHCAPLLKLSIVPRGMALGYAQYMPKDQYLRDTDELFDNMCMTLGGRVAEMLTFGKVSTGAQDDLDKVTKNAYSQVMVYGMNPVLGPISFSEANEGNIDKPFSEKTGELIDNEVRKLVSNALEKTTALLRERSKELGIVANMLLEKEKLKMEDLEGALGPRPHHNTFLEQITSLLPDEWKDPSTGAVKEQHVIDKEQRLKALEREGLSETGQKTANPNATIDVDAEMEPSPDTPGIQWGFYPKYKRKF